MISWAIAALLGRWVDGLRSYRNPSEAVVVRHRADVPCDADTFALGEGVRADDEVDASGRSSENPLKAKFAEFPF
jgi:hypothetical protein